MTKKKISILNKKNAKLLAVFFSILIFVWISFAYSQNWSAGEWSSSFWDLFMSLADLIWSIWFIFPIIAGKLLTNDFVYWAIFNLDATLWNIWNFSRTLANFIIWFTFIYLILKYLLNFTDKDASILKTWLPKIVISSVLVNMSWFILWVLIDISTILIAAFGSLPANAWVMEPPLVFPKNIEVTVQKCDPKISPSCIKGSQNVNVKDKNPLTLADLQTYETTISWPLFFIWASILEIWTSKDKLLNQAYDAQAKKFKHDWQAIKAIIKIIIFLLFLIPIIILIVVNIVRIFWIWMYAAFSPLLFLYWIFGKNKLAGANKAFAFKNVIWLIFSPALVVGAFSVSVILILWVADALNPTEWTDTYEESVKKTFLLDNSDWSVLEIDFWQAQDTWRTWSKYIWWFIGYLIVSLLVIFLSWSLIKLSFKASEVTRWISDKMFKFSEDLFKTIPMPTPMWPVSLWALKGVWQKIQAIPSNMLSNQTQRLDKIFNKESDVTDSKLNDIERKLSYSNDFNTSLNELFNEISRFKWKTELENSTNAKKLIDKLVTAIWHNPWLTGIKSTLSTASTYQDKLNIILRNQDTIKWKLKNTDFNLNN